MSTIRVEFSSGEHFRTTDIIDKEGNSSFTIPLEIEGVIIAVYNESANKKLVGFDKPYTKTSRDVLTITTTERHWIEDKKEILEKENRHKFSFVFDGSANE